MNDRPILIGPSLAAIHQLQVTGQLTAESAASACGWDPRTISAVIYQPERQTRLRTAWQRRPGVDAVLVLQDAFALATARSQQP
jgi:hypothetical protein